VRRVAYIALVSVGLLAGTLAGCGGSQKQHSSDTTTNRTATTRAPTPAKPIATVQDTAIGQNQPNRFRVSIYDLRRDGPFLVLDFGVKCLTPNPGCALLNSFTPSYEAGNQVQYDSFTPAGVTLIDPTNLMQYKVVRDSEQRPYVSRFAQGAAGLTDSMIHLQWVRYALPPPGTNSLDVALPDGGPVIPNVPITGGSGPTAGGQLEPAQASQFAQPPASANTAGLTLPVEQLIVSSGNSAGSDSESPGRAQLTLRSDVLFKFDKSNLTPKAQTILQSVAQQIKARARGTVKITGYTDSIGTDAVNLPLSQARARSVKNALSPLTPGVSYTASGLGSADPVAPNTKPDGTDNPAGRALNRRVTIAFAATAVRPTPPAPSNAGADINGQATAMTFLATWAGGNDTYNVSSASAYRVGNLLVVAMTLGCSAGKVSNTCYPEFDLDGLPTVPPQPLFGGQQNTFDPAAIRSLSGFYVLDPATGTEYIPVRGTDNVPLTSNFWEQIPAGQEYRVWLYFPAPPSTTSTVTLVSPGGVARLGPLEISSAAPASP
jgi:outer membrane protein OmpA-like peptidoglycan-associated protein